ncbi:MAG TPA: CDP-alcohol phosphatidyltransferase family protein [Caulobacteraceae bacterium]|nr:CDP-alcohol phosphatidyltransferase family protein [Caulobacteraceae bacterium]
MVAVLIPTGVSPNAVSILGAVMAAAAAGAFVLLPWPASALVGLACLLGWHVFDGADGDLARRTGRASPNGELVDGLCDHLGQASIYLAFALMLSDGMGLWAWVLPLMAGLSRAGQASAYEACRRNYRRWVYDARWIRQTLARSDEAKGSAARRLKLALARTYVAISRLVSADDRAVEWTMERLTAEGGDVATTARQLYRRRMAPLVKRASTLSANYRSLAAFLSVLAGAPLGFVLYELVALNLVLVWLRWSEARANRDLVEALAALEASPS